jgi:tRNA(Ile)-lysidine synthase
MALLPSSFVRNLTGPCGLQSGQGVVVAVSGGPDSMALLYLLAHVRLSLELSLCAVWVDHGLRPDETPAEYDTVFAATRVLNVPFFAHTVDTKGLAAQEHLSVEHAARMLRYQVLREVCSRQQADCIAVAHTADDQSEEVLLRLLRGSGRKGVAGMRMRSNDIIRPLLDTEKSVILSWLDQQGIDYCYDSSNEDLKFVRNRVRHRLLPFLEANFDQHVSRSLRKTAAILAEDEDLLEQLAQTAYHEVIVEQKKQDRQIFRLEREPFCSLHPALQRRVVEQLLWNLDSRAGFDHIMLVVKAACKGKSHTELHLSRGLRAGIFRQYLEFSYPAGKVPWRGRLFS